MPDSSSVVDVNEGIPSRLLIYLQRQGPIPVVINVRKEKCKFHIISGYTTFIVGATFGADIVSVK
jgi:ATP-dependent phosphoenolpyruvate carboxykinase